MVMKAVFKSQIPKLAMKNHAAQSVLSTTLVLIVKHAFSESPVLVGLYCKSCADKKFNRSLS